MRIRGRGGRVWPMGIAGALLAGALLAGAAAVAGCASPGAADRSRSPDRLETQPPAGPLYERRFTTPGGREWDFRIGGGYESER